MNTIYESKNYTVIKNDDTNDYTVKNHNGYVVIWIQHDDDNKPYAMMNIVKKSIYDNETAMMFMETMNEATELMNHLNKTVFKN